MAKKVYVLDTNIIFGMTSNQSYIDNELKQDIKSILYNYLF